MLNYLKKNCHINLLFLITIIINGCAYNNIEELKSTPNISNQFSQALSESYLEFAIYEMNEMHDEIDAAYFAKKGLKARKGEKVLPELIDNWDIEHSYKVEINQKRQELIKVLNTKRANAFPILSARTQLGYDCWLEQLEEAWQNWLQARQHEQQDRSEETTARNREAGGRKTKARRRGKKTFGTRRKDSLGKGKGKTKARRRRRKKTFGRRRKDSLGS